MIFFSSIAWAEALPKLGQRRYVAKNGKSQVAGILPDKAQPKEKAFVYRDLDIDLPADENEEVAQAVIKPQQFSQIKLPAIAIEGRRRVPQKFLKIETMWRAKDRDALNINYLKHVFKAE
jgi:hypothetical protein